MTVVRRTVEGKRRCGSCLQWVGTDYDGRERPYKIWTDDDGDHVFCVDVEACDRRWKGVREAERVTDGDDVGGGQAERFAASEAAVYDPEEDEDG